MEPWLSQLKSIALIQPIERLSSIDIGLSQTCFKVYSKEQIYFAKFRDDDNHAMGKESGTALIANNAGIAPKLIFSDQNWLIFEYIRGYNLANSPFNLQQKSLCALNLMRKLHQLEAPVETLNIEQAVHSLIAHSSYTLDQKAELYFIAATLKSLIAVNPAVLCHGDLSFANIMFDNRAWLVDFECSCFADIEYDVAMFIAINHLQPSQLPYFCQLYQQKSDEKTTINPDKVKHYLAFCYLINGLWFLAQSIEQQDHKIKQLAAWQLKHFDELQLSSFQTLSLMR